MDVANDYALVLDDPKPRLSVTAFAESSIELLFALWCRQENFMQVKDEMHELIRDRFLENKIEIPVPKIGFVDRPNTPFSNEDIDTYANQQDIKREPKL